MRKTHDSCGTQRNSLSSLISASEVSFGYSSYSPVIHRVSLSLKKQSLAALIGANGSGKSTLIRLLAGLLMPTRGAVYFEGCLLSNIPRQDIAQRIAYVPQTNLMIFPFTALEVVLTGRSPYTSRFQFESQSDCEKALAALERVGARHLAFRPITELSGGERQLIALARALAQEPQCLLLDEPSASLDLKHRAELIRLLRHLRDRQALSALVVTHDLQLLGPAFDSVFALRAGELVAEGNPAQVLQEQVLSAVYDDPQMRARRLEQRTFIWSEA
jgi:ABC-type cobalamin/Fe3+-siderophores transport system ATPase subunit